MSATITVQPRYRPALLAAGWVVTVKLFEGWGRCGLRFSTLGRKVWSESKNQSEQGNAGMQPDQLGLLQDLALAFRPFFCLGTQRASLSAGRFLVFRLWE
jgi:hypothetical protein